jgi:hypothetical protein
MATPQKIIMAARREERAKIRLYIVKQAEEDTTKLVQPTEQPELITLFVKVWVYAFTLPGRGVGMTNQQDEEAIDVNLVFWHSQFNIHVKHDIICEMFNEKKAKTDRNVLQCIKQGRGTYGFWISPVCYLRWVIYNHEGIDHHFLAYSEDSTDCFTPSELTLLHECFNKVHLNNQCTLLV